MDFLGENSAFASAFADNVNVIRLEQKVALECVSVVNSMFSKDVQQSLTAQDKPDPDSPVLYGRDLIAAGITRYPKSNAPILPDANIYENGTRSPISEYYAVLGGKARAQLAAEHDGLLAASYLGSCAGRPSVSKEECFTTRHLTRVIHAHHHPLYMEVTAALARWRGGEEPPLLGQMVDPPHSFLDPLPSPPYLALPDELDADDDAVRMVYEAADRLTASGDDAPIWRLVDALVEDYLNLVRPVASFAHSTLLVYALEHAGRHAIAHIDQLLGTGSNAAPSQATWDLLAITGFGTKIREVTETLERRTEPVDLTTIDWSGVVCVEDWAGMTAKRRKIAKKRARARIARGASLRQTSLHFIVSAFTTETLHRWYADDAAALQLIVMDEGFNLDKRRAAIERRAARKARGLGAVTRIDRWMSAVGLPTLFTGPDGRRVTLPDLASDTTWGPGEFTSKALPLAMSVAVNGTTTLPVVQTAISTAVGTILHDEDSITAPPDVLWALACIVDPTLTPPVDPTTDSVISAAVQYLVVALAWGSPFMSVEGALPIPGLTVAVGPVPAEPPPPPPPDGVREAVIQAWRETKG